MTGIITISHGDMATGILSAAAMICPEMKQTASLAIMPGTNPDDFQKALTEKTKEMNTGDGVLLLADMMGGSPCNRAIYCISDQVHLLVGMNLSMVVTAVTVREDGLPLKELIAQIMEEAHNGIAYVNDVLKQGVGKL